MRENDSNQCELFYLDDKRVSHQKDVPYGLL